MAERDTTLTVLFADISGSTAIIQQHGDRAGRAIVQRCLERAARVIAERGGWIVDRIGDELMCAILEADQAMLAALDIHDQVECGAIAGDYPVGTRMRIGLHHGAVLVDEARVFGETVHTAKRLVDMAKADQVLTTRDTLATAGELPGAHSRVVDEIRIKGAEQPLVIVEVLREGATMTIAATVWRGPGSGESYLRCRLRRADTVVTLDAARPSFTVGRLDHCDLCLPHSCVSREHARLEYQKGRIIVIDQSTNGTYIVEEAAPEPVLVHREQRWLRNRGLLRFGSREDDGRGLTLEYACETLGPEPAP